MKHIPSGDEVIQIIRAETDTIMLSFSCGKDSIATWLALKPHFKIIPVYLWLVPNLAFVNDSLSYYERFFDQRIYRLPHPSFYRWLNNLTYQAPEYCSVIEAAELPSPDYDEIFGMLMEDLGIGKTWMAIGVRAVDSPIRRAAVKTHGPINHRRKTFWPVWDWNKERLVSVIQTSGVRLPVDYKWFGRSFDGIDSRFTAPIKEHALDDYRRIMNWFPMAYLDELRRSYVEGTQ